MNNKVSIALRIIAVILAVGAVVLFFLIRGELGNALAKTKPLKEVAASSEEPYEYQNLKNAKELKEVVEIVKPATNEIYGRREQKKADDATIASQKATIEERDRTIAGLNDDLEAKNAENAELSRQKDDLTSKLATAERKGEELDANLRNEKEIVARLNERIANMKTMEDYQKLLDQIAELELKQEKGQNRYTRFRNWVRTRGEVVPDEFPAPLYGDPDRSGPNIQFGDAYVDTKIVSVDARKGLMVIKAGTAERRVVVNSAYEVEINGVKVAKILIMDAFAANAVAMIMPDADVPALTVGAEVKLIPFVLKQ